MILCAECGAVLANHNCNVKYVVCSFCLFEKSNILARREILFPEKEERVA